MHFKQQQNMSQNQFIAAVAVFGNTKLCRKKNIIIFQLFNRGEWITFLLLTIFALKRGCFLENLFVEKKINFTNELNNCSA